MYVVVKVAPLAPPYCPERGLDRRGILDKVSFDTGEGSLERGGGNPFECVTLLR